MEVRTAFGEHESRISNQPEKIITAGLETRALDTRNGWRPYQPRIKQPLQFGEGEWTATVAEIERWPCSKLNRVSSVRTECTNAYYKSSAIFSSWAAKRNLFSARASICRMRSLVTPSSAPTCFSVNGSCE